METKFIAKGIHCDACTRLIQMRIAKISGVHNVEVKEDGLGVICGEREIAKEEIQEALKGTDYSIEIQ